jgi:hypothetical protein
MIEDVHYGQDYGRLWMWLTALGTAMLVNFGAEALGFIDLSATLQLSNRYSILGGIVGGLLFGYGMAQAGNCGYGVLARLGGGDIGPDDRHRHGRHGQRGDLRCARTGCARPSFPWSRSTPSPRASPMPSSGRRACPIRPIGLAIGALTLGVSIRFQQAEERLRRISWGVVAGIAISSGFLGTYWVAPTGSMPWPVASHSFTAPIGETIHYAMFSSGLAPKFGMGSVLGLIVGGAIGSFIQDGFRWEACEDPRELRRQMGGAVAMGLGAVLAAGCSVGQGLSALSLLSTTAPIVAASIWIGAWIGLRHLIFGLEAA